MIGYTVRRLAALVPTWALVGLMTFLIIHLTPGDPAGVMLGAEATHAGVEAVRQRLGLDKPLWSRLKDWYLGVLQGDLGDSFFLGRPVATAIWERVPVTFALTICAMLVAVLVGLPLGVMAALHPNTLRDTAVTGLSLVGLSIPEFVLGLGMMYIFGVQLRWLPTGGYVAFTHSFPEALVRMVMPALSLGLIQAALIARMTRSAMLEALASDFVRTARAKGLSQLSTVWHHALRNALLPVFTVIGVAFALLLGGAFITEVVFRLPGMGSLAVAAVKRRDYPVVQGVLLVVATAVMLVNLIVDLAYAYLDPRIKYD